ncbi:MAG TPA: tRNA guanosine(34) transglycosylase Tgt [Patescibacteria group bacterium]|nr:tRNA guanosine(34) transglycosylase Tgt [Patescibacteria group bacterium]
MNHFFHVRAVHSSGARLGVLQTKHGSLHTPFFMPIATRGAVKTLSNIELNDIQNHVDSTTDPIVLSNTYHLYLKPGLDVLRVSGGLHQFMNWKGTILTDSGGFQIFSLAHLRKLSSDGVEFQSHIDGSTHVITPEKSMEIQSVIGSDIWMAFDYFPGYPATREESEHSVALTTAWAKRCKQWFDEYLSQKEVGTHQLFSIVQGATFEDLRKQSAQELIALDCNGYAIGGLAVGEPVEKMYNAIETVVPVLPPDKPRYLMGVGLPEQILEAVKRGVDMFDCVIPTRNARHGSLFIHEENSSHLIDASLSSVHYTRINMKAERYSKDTLPIDAHCTCVACVSGFSRAYLRHLFSINEPLAARLATIHNSTFYLTLMHEIRQHIRCVA